LPLQVIFSKKDAVFIKHKHDGKEGEANAIVFRQAKGTVSASGKD
jgi:hypothetical protein